MLVTGGPTEATCSSNTESPSKSGNIGVIETPLPPGSFRPPTIDAETVVVPPVGTIGNENVKPKTLGAPKSVAAMPYEIEGSGSKAPETMTVPPGVVKVTPVSGST